MDFDKGKLQKQIRVINPNLLIGVDNILSHKPTIYIDTEDLTWPVYDLEKDEFCADADKYLSPSEIKDLKDVLHGNYHLKVYYFRQTEDVYEQWTAFTVVSTSENLAWIQILAEYGENPDFEDDRSIYSVTELDLNVPQVIGHYSHG